jgi:hypothetical protein
LLCRVLVIMEDERLVWVVFVVAGLLPAAAIVWLMM